MDTGCSVSLPRQGSWLKVKEAAAAAAADQGFDARKAITLDLTHLTHKIIHAYHNSLRPFIVSCNPLVSCYKPPHRPSTQPRQLTSHACPSL
jgi:hypothetical protein